MAVKLTLQCREYVNSDVKGDCFSEGDPRFTGTRCLNVLKLGNIQNSTMINLVGMWAYIFSEILQSKKNWKHYIHGAELGFEPRTSYR